MVWRKFLSGTKGATSHMDMRLFGLQFSHEQRDSSRRVWDKMTMIYCVQLPHFQTHIFLAPNQSFQFNSV